MFRTVLLIASLLGWVRDPEHNGPPTATDTGVAWLSVLADGRAFALESATLYPFAYREAWAKKRCTRTAANTDAFARWIDCTHQNESALIAALKKSRREPKRLRLDVGLGAAGKRVRGLAGGGKGTWLSGWIKGDGVTYEFALSLSGNDTTGRRVTSMIVDSSLDR